MNVKVIISLTLLVGLFSGMNALGSVLSGDAYCDAVSQAKAEVATCK